MNSDPSSPLQARPEPNPARPVLAWASAAVAAALALLPLPSLAAARLHVESASVKVKPEAPHREAPGARLAAAMNEFEAFQIVVRAEGEAVSGVRATAGELRGPGGAVIPASALQLYRAEVMNVGEPSGTIGQTGRWPDALVPAVDEVDGEARNAFPFTVPAGEARAIWVDVLVPPQSVPGVYRGAVRVEGSGLSADVPVELEVWNFQLPSTPSLATAFLAFTGNVCRAHTGDPECGGDAAAAELMVKYQRLALDHRITLPNLWFLKNAKDWSAFDEAYGPLLDGTARTRLAGARMTSAQVTGKRDTAAMQPFVRHFEEKGWFDRLYDYTADEPPWGSEWADVPVRAREAKAVHAKLRTLVTTNIEDARANGVLEQLDMLVPIVNDMDGPAGAKRAGDQRGKYDDFVRSGKTLWLYQSCMSHGCSFGGGEAGQAWPSYMIDVPAVRNRLMQWADFRAGVTGELYYETAMAYSGDAWQTQYQFNGNGDGTLFYPGTPAKIGGASSVPVPSIRLKMIREGVEDFEYLTLVARLGDPTFAKAIAAQVLPSLYTTDQADPVPLESARRQLAQRILELRGGEVPDGETPGDPGPPSENPGAPDGPADPAPSDGPGSSAVDAFGQPGSGCGGSTAWGSPLAGLVLPAAAALLRRKRRR